MGNDFQKSDDILPIRTTSRHDLVDQFIGRSFKEGRNSISRNESGLELVATVAVGEVLQYAVVDRNGEPVDQLGIKVTDAKAKKTTCWECGVDAKGDTHCWKVPCPDIVGPWNPGKSIQPVLRFR
jgi:hypothetical protein